MTTGFTEIKEPMQFRYQETQMNGNYQTLSRVPGTQETTDLDSHNSQELTERRGSLGIDIVDCEFPHQDIDAELPLYTRICRTLRVRTPNSARPYSEKVLSKLYFRLQTSCWNMESWFDLYNLAICVEGPLDWLWLFWKSFLTFQVSQCNDRMIYR
jgi:hypothetical protein